jgi:hypothetical protein
MPAGADEQQGQGDQDNVEDQQRDNGRGNERQRDA